MNDQPALCGSDVRGNYCVTAYCTRCLMRSNFRGVTKTDVFERYEHGGVKYCAKVWQLLSCARCGSGALAVLHVSERGVLLDAVYPPASEPADLPGGTPPELREQYAEARLCVEVNANRAAVGLFRSVLERTLEMNGYGGTSRREDPDKPLPRALGRACDEGIVAEVHLRLARRGLSRAGDDPLPRQAARVGKEEARLAGECVLLILRDFYEHREVVETLLREKRRIG